MSGRNNSIGFPPGVTLFYKVVSVASASAMLGAGIWNIVQWLRICVAAETIVYLPIVETAAAEFVLGVIILSSWRALTDMLNENEDMRQVLEDQKKVLDDLRKRYYGEHSEFRRRTLRFPAAELDC